MDAPAPTRIFAPVSEEDDRIGSAIVDAAYTVHKELGPGLLESVYAACFCHVFRKRGFQVERQKPVPLIFDGEQLEDDLRLDVIVNDRVLCELKAVEKMNPVFVSQLLTYLKLSGRRLGYLINFTVPKIKDGITRYVR